MRRKDGSWRLTIIDLVVVLLLLPFVFIFVLNTRVDHGDSAVRVKCASNLKQIGLAIQIYENENHGEFPRGLYSPDDADRPLCFTRADANLQPDEKCTPTYCKNGPGPNDVTAGMFRLLQTEEITPEVFRCPSVDDGKNLKIDSHKRCNFTGLNQLDYSFANPYPSASAVKAGYKLSTSLSAEFAIAADMNPGVSELITMNPLSSADQIRRINSQNHEGDGQNVLYGDGHVEFQQNPYCGTSRDNIYTFGKSGADDRRNIIGTGNGIVGSPVGPNDSVLLPTATQK